MSCALDRLAAAWDELERHGAVVDRVPLGRLGGLAEPMARIEEHRLRVLADATAAPPAGCAPAERPLDELVERLVRLVADVVQADARRRPRGQRHGACRDRMPA